MKQRALAVSKKHFGISVMLFLTSALYLFLGTSIAMHFRSPAWQLADALAAAFAYDIRTGVLTTVMFGFTDWGTYATITGWLLLGGYMVWKRQWTLLVITGILSIGSLLFGMEIKHLVNRERPTIFTLVRDTSPGMPSNHALTSSIFYLTLSYLSYRFFRKYWITLAVFFLSLLMIFAIGFSRIYLGVHYASDVCAGFAFGTGLFLLVLAAERLFWTVYFTVVSSKNRSRSK